MELNLKIAGFLLIGLALIHVTFPKQFDWKNDLARLTLINRQVMYVHTLFIAIVLFMMGLLCITSANDLISTELGRRICFGFGVFWFIRLVVQFFGYSSQLWRGKAFETAMHILFSIFWIYLTATFVIATLA